MRNKETQNEQKHRALREFWEARARPSYNSCFDECTIQRNVLFTPNTEDVIVFGDFKYNDTFEDSNLLCTLLLIRTQYFPHSLGLLECIRAQTSFVM